MPQTYGSRNPNVPPGERSTGNFRLNINDADHEDFIKKVQFKDNQPSRVVSRGGAKPEESFGVSQRNGASLIGYGGEIEQEKGRNMVGRDGKRGFQMENLLLNDESRANYQSFGKEMDSKRDYGKPSLQSYDSVTVIGKGKAQTTFDSYNPHYGGGDPQEGLYLEYVTLLDSSNTKELQTFAVQNLSNIIDNCVFGIMQNKPIYLKLLNLIDLNMGPEDREHQKKILLSLAKHLTEERACDAIADNIIERVLRAFNRSGHDFHEVFAALIFAHIIKSNYDVRVNALVEMLKTPYIKLQDLALKILKDISKPDQSLRRDYTIEFENHIRFILEASLSKDRSLTQVNHLIEIAANLCINDYLSPEIIHHSGIETLLLHLREKANVEGQRLAARGLLNLGAKSRENKLRIVSELNYEIKALHRNELDNVVRSYIATLIQAKGLGSSEK